MNGANSSQWPSLIPALSSLLLAIAALWGYRLSKTRQPAEVRLLDLQGDVAEATKEKTRAEASKAEAERHSLAFNVVSGALADAQRTIDRLREERDKLLAEVRLLDLQLEREAAWRTLHKVPAPPAEGREDEQGRR